MSNLKASSKVSLALGTLFVRRPSLHLAEEEIEAPKGKRIVQGHTASW